MKNQIGILLLSIFVLSSCVSKKKFTQLQEDCDKIQATLDYRTKDLANCEEELDKLKNQLSMKDNMLSNQEKQLQERQEEINFLKTTNTNLLDRLSDLAIINKAGAESIKKSLDAINEQTGYIKDLNEQMKVKDSLNLVLVKNLKRSLGDVNDEDIQVEVRKGVVYVSISDKLLFRSGSSVINKKAMNVLEKVAKVVNDHKELEILVEGHTDNVPINSSCIQDNWDLSVKRSTSVVRLLASKYGVAPNRMIAGGRGEHAPKSDNTSKEGRQMNRRTEIILTPQLDQFFNLMSEGK